MALDEFDINAPGYKDAETDFLDFYNMIKDEVQKEHSLTSKIYSRCHFKKYMNRGVFSGMVLFYFEEKRSAQLMCEALSGETYNNYMLHVEWVGERRKG